jgi:aminoglycoside phosphotransferase (APT) family kinase protein
MTGFARVPAYRPAPLRRAAMARAALRRMLPHVGSQRSWLAATAPRLAAGSLPVAGVGGAAGWRLERVAFTDTGLGMAVLSCRSTARRVIVKVPGTAEGVECLRRQAAVLAALSADPRFPGWSGQLPRCLAQGEVDGRYYGIEEALPGAPVTAVALRGNGGGALLAAATDVIGDLHGRTARSRSLDAATVEAWVHRPLGRLHARYRDRPARRYVLERIRDEASEALLGRVVRTCWIHGDFWPGNLLASGPTLTGVVDWDRAEAGQLPLYDLLHVHVLARRLLARAELGEVVARALGAGVADAVGVPADTVAYWFDGIPHRTAVLLYWLRHVSLFIDSEGHGDNPRWLRRNVERVLDDA